MAKDDMATKGKPRGGKETLPHQEEQQLFSFTPLQLHFLTRLKQLESQRVALKGNAVGNDDLFWRVSARAMYSTYQDCVDVGVGEEANAILQGDTLNLLNPGE